MSADLLPCPFCGSSQIDAAGWASQTDSGPACQNCGASAGTIGGFDNIASWNARVSDQHWTATLDNHMTVTLDGNVVTLNNEAGDQIGYACLPARVEPAIPADERERAIEWRCFHCGDLFTDERCARLHFGRDEHSQPACLIKAGAEQGLLGALREAEYAAADARQAIANESTEAAQAYYAQATRHNQALRNAEEAGYERGLADGQELGPTASSTDAPARVGEGKEWRCFFCDESFTDPQLAHEHFGFTNWEPGCVNKLVQSDASRRAELVRTEDAFRKAVAERDEALAKLRDQPARVGEGEREALCKRVFLAAHSDGWTGNQLRRDAQHVDAEKSWELYVSNGALRASIAAATPTNMSLYREIDALGATGEGERWAGYSDALTDVLAILERRGFSEQADAPARVGEGSTVAFVQDWMMSGDHDPSQWERDFAAAIDGRTVDVAALAKAFCAAPLPASVCADPCASMTDYPHPRSGTNLLTVSEAEQVLRHALAATTPTNTTRAESEGAWQDIATAPKDRRILARGHDWGRETNPYHVAEVVWFNDRWRNANDHSAEMAYLTDWLDVPLPATAIRRETGEAEA